MNKTIFILLAITCFNLSANELRNEDAKALAEQLKHSINSTVSRIIELEKQSLSSRDEISFNIQNESDDLQELGLILSNNSQVIAVTPNSLANKMGFQSGDMLKKVTSDDLELNITKPMQFKANGLIVASVERDGVIVELSGKMPLNIYSWELNVQTHSVPSNNSASTPSSCGRVSVFFRPPETKDYYSVIFNQWNDRNVNQGRNVLRLSPGLHKIKVNELINAKGIRIRRPFRIKGKVIEINVEPNKTYHLAAEFDSTKRLQSKGEEYWNPIVWKITDKECEL